MLSLKELKNLSSQDLNDEILKTTKDLFKKRFDVNTGTSKANHEIRNLRKYRAQILTIKKQLEKDEKDKFKNQKQL